MQKKILIIEDDEKIAKLVQIYAEKDGFKIYWADDGKKGLETFESIKPDFVILDLMLPEVDGFDIARIIRSKSKTPILILTAKAEEFDKILGLEFGADDYLTKPFSPRELMARIKTILRRVTSCSDDFRTDIFSIHDLEIDPLKMEVKRQNQSIQFSNLEFRLVLFLAKHPGHVFSRDKLMQEMYPEDDVLVFDRTVDVHIKNIRKKLHDDPKRPKYIQSVFGAGYRFIEE